MIDGADDKYDKLYQRLRREALEALSEEPELELLLQKTVLAEYVDSFESAIATTVSYRMLLHPSDGKVHTVCMFCPNALQKIMLEAMKNTTLLEKGHTMKEAIATDVLSVVERDPACQTILEVILFFKGFAALVCHRVARQKWISGKNGRSMTALFFQSQASAVFGVDIHPAATIGKGILLDHGTGIVIGETAHIGDGCTLLHGVTLGGTGKQDGDRHPKLGDHVLIGANASILGNIPIGSGAKIGAGSIVLRSIPPGATAVGAPAKIIGRALSADPATDLDGGLEKVGLLHKSVSSVTMSTLPTTSEDSSSSSSISSSTYAASSLLGYGYDDDSTNGGGLSSSYKNDLSAVCDMGSYTEYYKLARSAPKHTVTILTIRKLLLPEGCTPCQVGSVFFALDTSNVGYLKPEYFVQHAPKILEETIPELEPAKIQSIVKQGSKV